MENTVSLPTDPVEIQKEIDELLLRTPATSDRGRLTHLLNALVATASASGAAYPTGYMGTFKCENVEDSIQAGVPAAGCFRLTSNNPYTGDNLKISNVDLNGMHSLIQWRAHSQGTVVVAFYDTEHDGGLVTSIVNMLGSEIYVTGDQSHTSVTDLGFDNDGYGTLTKDKTYDVYVLPYTRPTTIMGELIQSFMLNNRDGNAPSRGGMSVNGVRFSTVTKIMISYDASPKAKLLPAISTVGRTLFIHKGGDAGAFKVSAASVDSGQKIITYTVTYEGTTRDDETLHINEALPVSFV